MRSKSEDEMKMIAKEDVAVSTAVTPLIAPLVSSLHSSLLLKHCYSCLRKIVNSMTPLRVSVIIYCSKECHDIDSPIFSDSGEEMLLTYLNSNPDAWPTDHTLYYDNSYIRLALRFRRLLPTVPDLDDFPTRLLGLSWIDEDQFTTVQRAAFLMDRARCLKEFKVPNDMPDLLDMRVLTLVISNAVPVRAELDNETVTTLFGFALYDYRLSWINHSCEPNSFIRFVDAFQAKAQSDVMLIEPCSILDGSCGLNASCKGSALPEGVPGNSNYGPRATLITISEVLKGKEVTISYVDVKQSLNIRNDKLRREYRFTCTCTRCVPVSKDKSSASLGKDKSSASLGMYMPSASFGKDLSSASPGKDLSSTSKGPGQSMRHLLLQDTQDPLKRGKSKSNSSGLSFGTCMPIKKGSK